MKSNENTLNWKLFGINVLYLFILNLFLVKFYSNSIRFNINKINWNEVFSLRRRDENKNKPITSEIFKLVLNTIDSRRNRMERAHFPASTLIYRNWQIVRICILWTYIVIGPSHLILNKFFSEPFEIDKFNFVYLTRHNRSNIELLTLFCWSFSKLNY